MAFIEVNNKKVHVVELNPCNKQKIIMVHGLFTSLSLYYFSIAPRLAKSCHVILYDLHNHGLSERRDEGYSPEALSNSLIGLMDEMNITCANLVGYSFGGLAAMYTALRQPGRVSRLALIDTPLLWEPVFDKLAAGKPDLSLEIKNYTHSVRIPVTNIAASRVNARWESLFENGQLADSVCLGRRLFNETPPEGLQAPTLLLYGNRSPYAASGRELAQRTPNSKLEIGRGDHNLPVQSSLWVAGRLKSFFNRPAHKKTAIELVRNIFSLGKF